MRTDFEIAVEFDHPRSDFETNVIVLTIPVF